jgi:hypothetical protein
MKKTIVAFSRVYPELLETIATEFNAIQLDASAPDL